VPNPILTPEQATQLRDKNYLSPEFASQFIPQVAPEGYVPPAEEPPPPPPMEQAPPQETSMQPFKEGFAPKPAGDFMSPPPVMDYAVDPVSYEPDPQEAQNAMNAAYQTADKQIAPYQTALDTQESNVRGALDAADLKGRQEASALAGYQDEAKKIEMQRAEIESIAAKKAEDAKRVYDQKISEVGSQTVDTNRLYKNMGTGQKIMAAIGIALGGLGKGPNQALAAINSAIDRDIEEQKIGINQKERGATAARTAYQDFLSQAKDEKVATLNMKMAAYENTKLKMAQVAARYQGTQAALNAQQALAQIDLQKAALQQQRDAMVVRAAYTMGGAQGANPMDAIQNVIPEKFQKDAVDELGKKTGWDNLTSELLGTFDRMNKVGPWDANVPGYAGGKAESYGAENAKIAGAIIGKVPGIKSDSDFKNIVLPMLPKGSDTPEQARLKKAAFAGFLKQNGPTTPILSSFGMAPKGATLKTAKPN
jgi:acyl-CoA thioesterase FadM